MLNLKSKWVQISVAQLFGHTSPTKQSHWFDSLSGTCLGCGSRPWLGCIWEGTNWCFSHRCFLSLSPSLPLFLLKKNVKSALAAGGQWIEHRPMNQMVTCLIPSQGTGLGCGVGPPVGRARETTTHWCFSPFLLPFPSLKINKN